MERKAFLGKLGKRGKKKEKRKPAVAPLNLKT